MFFVPYHVDVPIKRYPIANWAIIASIVFVTFMWFRELPSLTRDSLARGESLFVRMILQDWHPLGLFGHVFLHGGLLHLAGNMLFLWLFGNAVCAKIGNVAFVFAFFCLGAAAGAGQLLLGGGPALGASGAVNGVVGMFLVLYPLNSVSCYYFVWFVFLYAGTFSVSSFWIILLWFAYDVFGLSMGLPGVAYGAHLAGFGVGFLVLAVLVKAQVVRMDRGELSIFHMLGSEPSGGRAKRSPLVKPTPPPEAARWPSPEAAPFDSGSPHSAQAPASRPLEWPAASRPPAPAGFLRLKCPCDKRLQVAAVHAGKVGRCPQCGRKFRIPASRG